MDKSYSMGELMSLYYEKEFAAVEEAALPEFSAKHKRKMRRIFSLFEKNNVQENNFDAMFTAKSPFILKKGLLLNIMIIVGIALLAGCANALISKGLSDNYTSFFPFDVPEGYLLYEGQINDKRIMTVAIDDSYIELPTGQKVNVVCYPHINDESDVG